MVLYIYCNVLCSGRPPARPPVRPIIRVEVRVYVQKVKHLEYEHQNNIKSIAMDGEQLLSGETDMHG